MTPYETHLRKALDQYGVPDYMHDAVIRYVLKGIAPGHFLSSVIVNDLFESFANADDVNRKSIQSYITFFYNAVPGNCYGGDPQMEAWIEQGGMEGIEAKREAAR